MNRRHSTNDGMVLYDDVTRQSGFGDNDVVCEHNIMADVTSCEYVIVGGVYGFFSIPSSAVDGCPFPNGVAVADFSPRGAATPFQVLSFQPNRGEGINI